MDDMEEMLWNLSGRFIEIGWAKVLIWKFDWDSYDALLHIGKLRIWFKCFRKVG